MFGREGEREEEELEKIESDMGLFFDVHVGRVNPCPLTHKIKQKYKVRGHRVVSRSIFS